MNIHQMKRIASKSDHKLYQHCSLIYAGSRLLVYGYNTKDLHAEIVAIRRLEALIRNQKRRPRNLHMVNLMIKRRSGNLGNSAPCYECRTAMNISRIRSWSFFDGAEFQQDEFVNFI